MTSNFNFLLPIFFAFFVVTMIARYAIFSAQRRELQKREDRLRVLEQKVETILRHLNLQ